MQLAYPKTALAVAHAKKEQERKENYDRNKRKNNETGKEYIS